MSIAAWIVVVVATMCAMELYAALVHRWLWHGPLWRWHAHHHGRFAAHVNANDALSGMHAPIAIALIALGLFVDIPFVVAVGAGMTAFGALYFVFHDGVVHGRLPLSSWMRSGVVRAWRDAHAQHHRGNGAPYGFFSSPLFVALEKLSARRHGRP